MRQRGGTAIYLRNDLNGKLAFTFSNSVIEYVIVKVKKLDAIIISLYRPPDTVNNEWNHAIKSLVNDINLCQSNGTYERIILGGDINMSKLHFDDNGFIIYENNMTQQSEKFTEISNNLCLFNIIDKPTRGDKILDLVMTNDKDIFTHVEMEHNQKFSDHNLMTIGLSFDINSKTKNTDNLEYPNEIPLYNWRYGTKENWDKYRESLDKHNWNDETSDMNIENKIKYFYEIIEDAVKTNFDKKEIENHKKGKVPKKNQNHVQ